MVTLNRPEKIGFLGCQKKRSTALPVRSSQELETLNYFRYLTLGKHTRPLRVYVSLQMCIKVPKCLGYFGSVSNSPGFEGFPERSRVSETYQIQSG